jgi:hypothetical protein
LQNTHHSGLWEIRSLSGFLTLALTIALTQSNTDRYLLSSISHKFLFENQDG